MELQVRRGAVLSALPELNAAMDVLHGGEMSGLVLTVEDDDGVGIDGDAAQLSASSQNQRENLLRRESESRMRVLEAPVPVIMIADGLLTGAAAALFLAGSHRVCTERTVIQLRECRIGTAPSFGLLDSLAALPQPHVAMAAAMGALDMGAHDMMELSLGTHYARDGSLDDLITELRSSPPEYYDVPLARRCMLGTAPQSLVPLYSAERAAPLNEALLACFGPGVASAREAVRAVQIRSRIAAEHATALANEPCGEWKRTLPTRQHGCL